MREPLVDKDSKEELEKIVKESKCMKDVLRSIGYSTVCGKNKINLQSEMCAECRRIERQKNILEKQELGCLVMNHPFTKIGALYHVSDNAVRKWCKLYGLPSTKRDIKQLQI